MRSYRFTTLVVLVFGVTGLLAAALTLGYSLQVNQHNLDTEIHNSLQQRQRTLTGQIESRLELLDAYLHSTLANQVFSHLAAQEELELNASEELLFLFRDSRASQLLDFFFLLDTNQELVFDAGTEIYPTAPLIAALRPSIHYTFGWRSVHFNGESALLMAAPVFDPGTLRLRGYLFIGLALSQNRAFHQRLLHQADIDFVQLDQHQRRLLTLGETTGTEGGIETEHFIYDNGLYLMQQALTETERLPQGLVMTLGLNAQRVGLQQRSFLASFAITGGGFLFLLAFAALLLHHTHHRAIKKLMAYIKSIQQGNKEQLFQSTSIVEYNRVGAAMEQMVADLTVAARVFESAEGMLVTDEDRAILRVNAAFTDITGYTAEQALHLRLEELLFAQPSTHNEQLLDDFSPDRLSPEWIEIQQALHEKGWWQGEIATQRHNGQSYQQWLVISAVYRHSDGRLLNYVVTLLDISQRKAAEQKIRHLAFFDQLTGLPNRQYLLDHLAKRHLAAQKAGRQLYAALISMDIDDFKLLNDTQGHPAGDQLLCQIAERLKACLPPNTLISRSGGDEFTLLLDPLDKEAILARDQAEARVQQLEQQLNQPYYVNQIQYYTTFSLGIALSDATEEVNQLVQQADLAMYQAKAAGRRTWRFFEPSMQARMLAHAALAHAMRIGIEQQQFLLYYQAQYDDQQKLIGAEALVRWQHPERGMVSPAEFIPVAENTGLILPLGRWILDAACAELARWQQHDASASLSLAVNISVLQFRQPEFVEEVLACIARHHIPPQQLKLEITESLLLNDDEMQDTINKMTELQQVGIRFSLDDFGTGYSSLSYLKKLPLDQLKIDQSFVRDMLTDQHDRDISRTIISLAQSLELSVIAEGVEQLEQKEQLALFGCHAYQGYYFGRPVPASDFLQELAQSQRAQ